MHDAVQLHMSSNVATLSPERYGLKPRSPTCSLHGELVCVAYLPFNSKPKTTNWFTKKGTTMDAIIEVIIRIGSGGGLQLSYMEESFRHAASQYLPRPIILYYTIVFYITLYYTRVIRQTTRSFPGSDHPPEPCEAEPKAQRSSPRRGRLAPLVGLVLRLGCPVT